MKATADALATLLSTNNRTLKKTIEAKEGDDGRLHELNDIKEQVGLKSATGV